MGTRGSGPLIVVAANAAWNLVNFRAGLIARLKQEGFQVLAVAPPDAAMERRLAELGCEFAPVPFDAMGLSPLRDLATTLRLLRLLRRRRPAALLSWTIKPNVYGGLAARLCGVPAIPNISGLGTAFIRQGLLTQLVQWLYRVGLRRSATVLFQNEEDRALFVERGLIGAAQARIVPGSGIDTRHWTAPVGGRPEPQTFLMLARVVGDKGVREFVDAARSLRQTLPAARFVLKGQLDVANRTAITRDEVAAWVAEGAIEYAPPEDDVRPAIAAADFVVLPSYREGLSRVLLEAAAMARPIVTCDVPGCRDVVTDGVNGYLCQPRDAPSLADAMHRAATTSDGEWARMGQAGRALVEARFSAETVAGVYLDALRAAGVAAGR